MAGFKAGRGTAKQIFNLRILCEKYLKLQQDLFHVFMDFRKSFDIVLHAALLETMRLYNINASLITLIGRGQIVCTNVMM